MMHLVMQMHMTGLDAKSEPLDLDAGVAGYGFSIRSHVYANCLFFSYLYLHG